MSRRLFLICITAIALLIPTILFAQDGELSLQSLSDPIDAVTTSITDLTTRLEAAESIWSGLRAVDFSDGTCQIGMVDQLQDETVLKIRSSSTNGLT